MGELSDRDLVAWERARRGFLKTVDEFIQRGGTAAKARRLLRDLRLEWEQQVRCVDE
jgi:hypothetical protein